MEDGRNHEKNVYLEIEGSDEITNLYI